MKNPTAQRSSAQSLRQPPSRDVRRKPGGPVPRCPKPGRQTAPVLEPWVAAGLTAGQHTFCLAYLENGFNATAAYQKAHPTAAPATARTEGSRSLTNPNIRAYLNERLEDAWRPLQMGGDQALARIAFLVEETTDDRVKLAALKVILEQTGKLKTHPQSVDALAEALRENCALYKGV